VIGLAVRTQFDSGKVLAKARKGSVESLGHAGGLIRKVARHSIRRSPVASSPGTPPHTRRGQLRRAILYAVEKDRQSVVIGPDYGLIGLAAAPHEFGGRYRRERYPKRPFMGPALENVEDRLPRFWAGSVR